MVTVWHIELVDSGDGECFIAIILPNIALVAEPGHGGHAHPTQLMISLDLRGSSHGHIEPTRKLLDVRGSVERRKPWRWCNGGTGRCWAASRSFRGPCRHGDRGGSDWVRLRGALDHPMDTPVGFFSLRQIIQPVGAAVEKQRKRGLG